MIRFDNVTKEFEDKYAIRNVSFSIGTGEKFVLLGTSGSGKSTVLKHINGLLNPTEGSIYIKDKNIDGLNIIELRRNTGYIIQDVGLFPHYTIHKNISLIPELKNYTKPDIDSRVRSLMTSMKLDTSLLTKYPDELSGGQRQRVGIARALAGDPDLLLLDEPLSALDPITKQHIQDDFMHLEALLSKTMVWVTHDIKEAFNVGDTICLMNEGSIQQIGSAKDFLINPKSEFVQSFFVSDRLNHLINTLSLGDIVGTIDTPSEQGKFENSIDAQMKMSEFFALKQIPHLLNIEFDQNRIVQHKSDDIFRAMIKLNSDQ